MNESDLATPEIVSSDHQQFEPNLDDLDIPIALKKGTRACNKHPLHVFLTYFNLSPTHKGFLSSINSIAIPILKTLSEELSNESWNEGGARIS